MILFALAIFSVSFSTYCISNQNSNEVISKLYGGVMQIAILFLAVLVAFEIYICQTLLQQDQDKKEKNHIEGIEKLEAAADYTSIEETLEAQAEMPENIMNIIMDSRVATKSM
jgi:large-conductance mechanosensitive channel